MRVEIRLITTALCLLCGPMPEAHAQEVRSSVELTEQQAIERLMAAHPGVHALRADVDRIRAEQAGRGRWDNPIVSFTREDAAGGRDTFLVARQQLPVSGRPGLLREAGRLAIQTTEADTRRQILELQTDVRRRFTSLLLTQERERIIGDGVASLRGLIDVLRVREENGEGSRYDRMRGERALVALETERLRATAARARTRYDLAARLGPSIDADALVAGGPLQPAVTPVPFATLVAAARRNRPDYLAGTLAVERFDAERLAAERLRLPTPTIGAGLKRSDGPSRTASGYQVSIDVSVPLFDRGQFAAAAAGASTRRAEAEAAAIDLQIDIDVRRALAALTSSQALLEQYRQSSADSAEALVDVVRVGYEEGELGILELLDAERQVIDTRLTLVDLSAAVRQAAIELDLVTGAEAGR